MRNTTKLNHLLMLYDLTFSVDADGIVTLILLNKSNGSLDSFSDKTYGKVLNKAYSFMKKQMKEDVK